MPCFSPLCLRSPQLPATPAFHKKGESEFSHSRPVTQCSITVKSRHICGNSQERKKALKRAAYNSRGSLCSCHRGKHGSCRQTCSPRTVGSGGEETAPVCLVWASKMPTSSNKGTPPNLSQVVLLPNQAFKYLSLWGGHACSKHHTSEQYTKVSSQIRKK